MSANRDYSVTFEAACTPQEAFAAINNVRGWWSQAVEGDTDRLGAVFNYHYQDVHRATFRITEFVPGKKVAWHVVDNYFNFVKDKTEWTGTDIVFEIVPLGDATEVRFTHIGLVPDYECYDVCANAWGSYITGSLPNLLTTGQGQPNQIEEVVDEAREMSSRNYTTSFTVDQSPEEVFAAVNNVRGWWSEEVEGSTDEPGAVFTFQVQGIHCSTQKIIEWEPGKKVVWQVVDSQLDFIADKEEWTGTHIAFEIARREGRTELRFIHAGLVPALECYGECTNAWAHYINDSLFNLITTGRGKPERKEAAETVA